jgi:hypothetical protein
MIAMITSAMVTNQGVVQRNFEILRCNIDRLEENWGAFMSFAKNRCAVISGSTMDLYEASPDHLTAIKKGLDRFEKTVDLFDELSYQYSVQESLFLRVVEKEDLGFLATKGFKDFQ